MHRVLKTLRQLCLGLALSGAQPAFAGDLPDIEAGRIRAVIEGQLAAFAVDDGTRALSYAAPEFRRRFRDARQFLNMIRQHYPVVYRPVSVRFMPPDAESDGVYQAVEMSDSAGAVWIAIYRLLRLAPGEWRILGCRLVTGDGRAT